MIYEGLTRLFLLVAGALILLAFGKIEMFKLMQASGSHKKLYAEDIINKSVPQDLPVVKQENVPGSRYTEARNLFKTAMQGQQLSREQVLYIKRLLNEALGKNIKDYKGVRYKNDAHEIYSKLKSPYLTNTNYVQFIGVINKFRSA